MEGLTEHTLGVFWYDESEKGHMDVDGILVSGYYGEEPPEEPSFPWHVWPDGTMMRAHQFVDPIIIEWTIRIVKWPEPEQWENALRETLQALLRVGAKVAWCGLEYDFAGPAKLFAPGYAKSVFAALSGKYGFQCAAHLGVPFQRLSDEELIRLHVLVAGGNLATK